MSRGRRRRRKPGSVHKPKVGPKHRAPRFERWPAPVLVVAVLALVAYALLGRGDGPEPVVTTSTTDTASPGRASNDSGFLPTRVNDSPALTPGPDGMVWVPGGEFSMGAADPEGLGPLPMDTVTDAQPIHRVYVDGFWMDETEVTNAQFAEFVDATGYLTVAERRPTAEEFPGVPPESLVAGSVVFTPTPTRVPLANHLQWWRYQPGASWRNPHGPDSDVTGLDNHPVVHVAYEDAVAYAQWKGRRLPTEAEHEFAERGGLTGQAYAWGNDLHPHGDPMANTFQGTFPVEDSAADGHSGTSPVGQYPPNNYGLYDLTGNVWEWVSDWYRPDYYQTLDAAGEVARNPQGPPDSFDPAEPGIPKRVHRGGSFLCTDQFCARYLAGTRGKGDVRTSTNHVGFRTVLR